MENLRQLSAWPLTGADLVKVKSVLDVTLEEAGIDSGTQPAQRIARSILSAYASGVTDLQELRTYGRVVAKSEMRRPGAVDFEAPGSILN